MKKFNLSVPNILVGGGVTKYAGYLQFINDFCAELEYKPKILAIFDRDSEGRSKFSSLENKTYEHLELECNFINRFDNEKFNDIELEDFIYPDLYFDSVNKFLKKKKYSQIKKADRKKRTLQAYNKKPILDFTTEICRQNNEDKNEINFNTLNMKLFLSKTVCEMISKKDILEYDRQFPEVKKYLESILKSSS